ncbi:hypothetical protein BDV30DRAFT_223995 [Aspergillus minisclerotigenes]|uniref:Fungal-type protein kinase domain-containing protein n=1 Tax=Aspergillus minisclerotigenes TaxID=656917 RepID=A0A5N6JDU0_9EURO|nr:hypothetical protein BDV30DRAFT_223995 [Aspergillus minisclerotigenes]
MTGKVPDVVLMTTSGSMRIVGEMKTRWVVALAHLRHILESKAQIAGYMKMSDRKYGFISTYEETIFLKQDFKMGSWTLFHGHAIRHSTTGQEGLDFVDKVSLRECFWFLIG